MADTNNVAQSDLKQGVAEAGQVTSILIVGVGGQGTLLASRVLAQAVLLAGAEVKVSEVHGMAQRGGSVVTQVRYGSRVYSPLVQVGQTDFILAFEKLEAIRWLPYLKKGGCIIVNDQSIDPLPVLTGAAKYPENIPDKLKAAVENSIVVDAAGIASQLGNARVTNVVLLGILASYLDLPTEIWDQALEKAVPAKVLELNREAFRTGFKLVKQ